MNAMQIKCDAVSVCECAQPCLYYLAVRKDVRVKKIYTGSMRITNQVFEEAYENSTTPEFKALAAQVSSQVRVTFWPPSIHCSALRNVLSNSFYLFSKCPHSFSAAAVSFS